MHIISHYLYIYTQAIEQNELSRHLKSCLHMYGNNIIPTGWVIHCTGCLLLCHIHIEECIGMAIERHVYLQAKSYNLS